MSDTTVADVVVDGLARAGVVRAFAGPAGGPLRDACAGRGLAVVATASAAAAATMAAVSGLLERAPGAAIVAGPVDVRGAAADRAPLVVLRVADQPTEAPAGVKARLVLEPASAAHWIAHACQLAMKAPRGPVEVDVTSAALGAAALPVATGVRPARLPPAPPAMLDDLARRIGAASRPVVLAGLECEDDDAWWIRPFAESVPAPVLVTPRAKGAVPDPHPLALGVLGSEGPQAALVARADLVIALGLDAAECRGWTPSMPVVRVGRSAAEGVSWAPALDVVAEIGLVLEELAPRLRDRERADWDVAWLDRLKRGLGASRAVPAPGLPAWRAVQLTREATPAGTVAAVDASGPTADALAFWHCVAPHQLLLGDEHAPGFGARAAVAAALARPWQRPVCFTGDVGLEAARDDLARAAGEGVRVLVVVTGAARRDEAGFEADLVRAVGQRGVAVIGG
ncbi:MAG: thiamine pyrophosphate-binding protein [Candidatus Rokubacteria bacterium]|nr:thiamine pyrophosphate-binding protein [Candidatus Rokubacteria bacterium]